MRRYLLRWVYHFANKPSVSGQWLQGSEGEAAKISREGLVRAVIEAKDFVTREVFPLYEVDGQDFVLFQWLAELNTMTSIQQTVGLRIRARGMIVDVFTNGHIEKKPIEDDFNFASLKY